MIIGLDGATFDAIKPMASAGKLPGFSRLMAEGSHGVLKSTIPPLTPPAWTTISTGVNPGKHGLFEFQRITPDHRLFFNSSRDKYAPDLWDYMPERKVIIAHLPFTYPPRRVNGILISGMMTPGLHAHHTEPESVENEINERFPDYSFLISWQKYLGREQVFLERIMNLFDQRLAMLDYLMEFRWDLLLFVLMEIDSAQHCFWGTEIIEKLYQKADTLILKLMDCAERDGFNLMIISDHGFARVDKWIFLNELLEESGFLAFKSAASAPRARVENLVVGMSNRLLSTNAIKSAMSYVPQRAVDWVFRVLGKGAFEERNEPCPFDWARTRAFMTSYFGLVYLDRRSVFDGGSVAREDVPGLKEEVALVLKRARDPETGGPIITDVLDASGVYTGREVENGPDLLAIPAPGYAFSPLRSSKAVRTNNLLSGEHHPDGIFNAWGPDVARSRLEGLWVGDIAPTVLHAMGHPIPDDMDGSVISRMFTPDSVPGATEPRYYTQDTPLALRLRIDRLRREGKF
ncbi:MAG: alkaline phosphatase family protein [Actinobacteria bacterium]|nr:alkaline phosphatase family protein [Actinomycetota bacterium]MBU1944537.1 alkaline phosphatase family protein [Actinomycetota bacterium]MBU2689090.1 alkaline phosphatase family protein [Actinomycetota bacterium]